MGNYNELAARLQCPRCGQEAEMVVDLYFGFRDLISFNIGDRYPWKDGRSLKNGGRPIDGNLEGEGYTECPNCKKDFFVVVSVRNDILASVQPDLLKKPLIP